VRSCRSTSSAASTPARSHVDLDRAGGLVIAVGHQIVAAFTPFLLDLLDQGWSSRR
jgi:hypothetical protein